MADGQDASGIVVVPHDEDAQLFQMVKHFRVVGRREAGSPIEMNRLGRWEHAKSVWPSLILAFPRSAGVAVLPMELDRGQNPQADSRDY